MTKVIRNASHHLETCACGLCGSSEAELILTKGQFNIVRCTRCNLIRTNPRMSGKYLMDAVYQTDASHIDRFQRFYLHSRKTNYRRWLTHLEPFRKINRLLDVGCGPGYFLEEASTLGWEPIGIEPSAAQVGFGAKQGLSVIWGRAEEIQSLVEGEFDVVTFWDVFEHLADPLTVALAVHSVLRPGGVVFMRLPDASILSIKSSLHVHERPPYSVYIKYIFPWYPDRHLYHYSPETLSNLMTRAGFNALDSWSYETMDEKVIDASSWWKRWIKRIVLWVVVNKGWPHEFVHISAKPSGGS